MHEEASLWQTSATSAPGTIRYMAPELLNATASSSSKESDVYAYSMTSWVLIPSLISQLPTDIHRKIQEIVTGRVPFSQYKLDGAVLKAVCLHDERPQRLIEDITPERLHILWSHCWDSDLRKRPTMTLVCESLMEIVAVF
jgi:serine/threonine protein kinase